MIRNSIKAASVICLLASMPTVIAAPMGGYFGIAGGRTSARLPSSTPFNITGLPNASVSKNTVSWAERGFTGWNVTPYFGLELGYTNYGRMIYNARAAATSSQFKYNFRGYDAVGKVYLPLGYTGGNFYALAGATRITETLKATDGGIPLNGNIARPNAGVSHNYLTRPIYGLGGSVTLYRHLTIAMEVTQISHIGRFAANATSFPALTMGTLGVAYNY